MQSITNRTCTRNWIDKHMVSRNLSNTSVSVEQCSKAKDSEAVSNLSTHCALHKFQNSAVLASEISKKPQRGWKVKRSIVASDSNYPLVRVTEIIGSDPTTGEEEVLDAVAVVADHIRVKLRPGPSESDLQSLNEKLGGHLRRNLYTDGTYLISFSNPDVHTVTSAVIAYTRESEIVQSAEPDFILRAQCVS